MDKVPQASPTPSAVLVIYAADAEIPWTILTTRLCLSRSVISRVCAVDQHYKCRRVVVFHNCVSIYISLLMTQGGARAIALVAERLYSYTVLSLSFLQLSTQPYLLHPAYLLCGCAIMTTVLAMLLLFSEHSQTA